MAITVHGVIGKGNANKPVIHEGLRDVLKEGDTVAVPWFGAPPPEGLSHVYDYLLDNDVPFVLYHEEGTKVPKAFTSAENGIVQQVTGSSYAAVLKSLEGKGKVLMLWDESGEEDSDGLTYFVVDRIPKGTLIFDLTSGLTPIVVEDDAAVEDVEEEREEVHGEEPVHNTDAFTRDELLNMPITALKRLAESQRSIPVPAPRTKEAWADLILGEVEMEEEIDPTDDALPVAPPSFGAELNNVRHSASDPLERIATALEHIEKILYDRS